MSSQNPYACPSDVRTGSPRNTPFIGWFYTLGALWLLGIAARQFLSAVLDPIGLLAGLLLALIATVVGRMVGTQRGAQVLTITASTLLFVALVRGWLNHPGEERSMWGFACMCSGLLLGAAYPFRMEETSSDEAAEGMTVVDAADVDERRN